MLEIDYTVQNKAFDNFVTNHSTGELLQMASWGEVKAKTDWYYRKIAIKENNNIVSTSLVLFRRLGIGKYTIAYVPKGFVGNTANSEVNLKMFQAIKELCKENHAIFVDFETNTARDSSEILVNDLNKSNFKLRGREEKDFPYQTKYDMIVYFNDEEADIRELFSKKSLRDLKIAEKAQLFVKKADISEIDIFTELSNETGRRNGISLRNSDYYKNILEIFSEENNIDFYLVGFDIDTFKANIENNKSKLEKEIATLQKKIDKSIDEDKKLSWKKTVDEINNKITSLNKDIEEVSKNKTDTIYLSGCLVLYCGEKAYYLYAASSSQYRYLQPNIYMNYIAMEEAKKRGCTSYNLGGVKDINDNLYTFKKSIGGELVEYEGVYSYVINKPIHTLFETALKLRKKILNIKNKRK